MNKREESPQRCSTLFWIWETQMLALKYILSFLNQHKWLNNKEIMNPNRIAFYYYLFIGTVLIAAGIATIAKILPIFKKNPTIFVHRNRVIVIFLFLI